MPNKQEQEYHPRMIVKVQIPIFQSGGAGDEHDVLIYNEDQSVSYVQPMTTIEVRKLKHKMKGEDKAFFYACTKCQQLILDELAPAQSW